MKTFQKPLTAEEEARYIQMLQKGSSEKAKEAREILIERNLRLVAHIAKKYQNVDEDMEDLISIGAYKAGTNPRLDTAVGKIDAVNEYLMQRIADSFSIEEDLEVMKRILA